MKKLLILSLLLVSFGTIKKNKEQTTSKSDFNASTIDFKRYRDSSFHDCGMFRLIFICDVFYFAKHFIF